jgi:hypothetical protein
MAAVVFWLSLVVGPAAWAQLDGATLPRLGPIQRGHRVPTPGSLVESRQRAAGVAASPERERQQLQVLNELTLQLAPGTPLPAPEVARRRG